MYGVYQVTTYVLGRCVGEGVTKEWEGEWVSGREQWASGERRPEADGLTFGDAGTPLKGVKPSFLSD
jgi:hypothetical protein